MNTNRKQNTMTYLQLSRGAAIVWMIVIIIGCTIPGPAIPTTLTLNDKLMHALIFVPFGFLWMMAGLRPVWVVAAGLLFGVSIELMQAVLPIHRNGDVQDALADFLGVLIGTGLGWGLQKVAKL